MILRNSVDLNLADVRELTKNDSIQSIDEFLDAAYPAVLKYLEMDGLIWDNEEIVKNDDTSERGVLKMKFYLVNNNEKRFAYVTFEASGFDNKQVDMNCYTMKRQTESKI